jgi:hypothetical protein
MQKKLLRWIILIAIFYGIYLWYFPNGLGVSQESDAPNYVGKLRANYAEEIDEICQTRNLPAEYFKALAILECSAQKPAPSRFEPKIFERLKEVRAGKQPTYGVLKTSQLRELTDEHLRDMATSWGTFQLMGYHAYTIGIAPRELGGEDGLRQSILWIEKNYGQYLRKNDFGNAFHIHNTGKPIPLTGEHQTYDSQYIPRGLEFIKIFQEERIKKEIEKRQDTLKPKKP